MTKLGLLFSSLLLATTLSACSVVADPTNAEAALESARTDDGRWCAPGDLGVSDGFLVEGTTFCDPGTNLYRCTVPGNWVLQAAPTCKPGSCGTVATNGCVRVYCGDCPHSCPCGGSYPHCMICNPD